MFIYLPFYMVKILNKKVFVRVKFWQIIYAFLCAWTVCFLLKTLVVYLTNVF
ncbi:hypothetical protein MtrunA17_Chr1g0183291 [Medicago truncatula]|uniref:Transmembrane protein n=1 Tax=Medicago truncatula TaxID=3880 RepID=A0A396JUK2_MEDTR|nr:hypothetical protein MtrunA17_Chr1g0183291 [Medicago truncatula]